jgi:hypothetical protein
MRMTFVADVLGFMNLIAAVADISSVQTGTAANWMSDPLAPDYLDQQGSYGLLSVVVGTTLALGLLYILHVLGGFGLPVIRNFRDQCRQRVVRETADLAVRPDYDQIILKCERELRDYLGRQ